MVTTAKKCTIFAEPKFAIHNIEILIIEQQKKTLKVGTETTKNGVFVTVRLNQLNQQQIVHFRFT